MPDREQFDEILREWIRVFMHRSMQSFAGWMNDSGLSKSQLAALMRLYYHGNCRISGMAGELGVTNAAASQIVERMVNMQLLERTEDLLDRRVKQVSLSSHGHSLLHEGLEARLDWTKGLQESLLPEQRAAVMEALQLLIEAARNLEAAHSLDLEKP